MGHRSVPASDFDDRSLADDQTGTVVDKHAASNRHGGMDIDGKDFGHAALQEDAQDPNAGCATANAQHDAIGGRRSPCNREKGSNSSPPQDHAFG
jgi:hypothetical protein